MDAWFFEEVKGSWRQGVRLEQELASEQSPYQSIQLLDTRDFGRMLVIDGKVQVCEMDEFIYHEMLAHLPLLSHPDPRRVVVMGGGDGGTAREALTHPGVTALHLVEIDQRVVDLCREHLPTLNEGQDQDPRLALEPRDAAEYIREVRNLDVILVDSSDPEGPSERLFCEAFYKQLSEALAPQGLVSLQAGSPFLYRDQVHTMCRELARVFRYVRPYLVPIPTYPAGTWALVAASQDIDPAAIPRETLEQRYTARALKTRYYSPEMQAASLTLPPFLKP